MEILKVKILYEETDKNKLSTYFSTTEKNCVVIAHTKKTDKDCIELLEMVKNEIEKEIIRIKTGIW
jgi:hypothetical protein